jgi:hypothetical protein
MILALMKPSLVGMRGRTGAPHLLANGAPGMSTLKEYPPGI